MSANFNKKYDKQWLKVITETQRKLEPYETLSVEYAFDQESEYDVKEISKEMRDAKLIKRVAFMKAALFIPEYILLRLLFPKKIAQQKLAVTKLYVKYLFNKISYYELKSVLKLNLKDDRMV